MKRPTPLAVQRPAASIVMMLGCVGFGMLGCKYGTSEAPTKIQYMPDMADSPTTKPQETFIDPPPGSVAMFAMIYPENRQEAEQLLHSPLPKEGRNEEEKMAIAKDLEKGKELYDTYCIPCHGGDGKGKGTVTDKFPQPPDITAGDYRNRTDGSIFHTITWGSDSKIMPSYGHAMDPGERWQVVQYVKKTLQGVP